LIDKPSQSLQSAIKQSTLMKSSSKSIRLGICLQCWCETWNYTKCFTI